MVDNPDRHLRRDLRFYQKQIPCKVALIQDSLAVEILRRETAIEPDSIEHKSFYTITKSVLSVARHVAEITEQPDISYETESLSNDAIYMLKNNTTSSDVGTCFISEKTGNFPLFFDNMFIENYV